MEFFVLLLVKWIAIVNFDSRLLLSCFRCSNSAIFKLTTNSRKYTIYSEHTHTNALTAAKTFARTQHTAYVIHSYNHAFGSIKVTTIYIWERKVYILNDVQVQFAHKYTDSMHLIWFGGGVSLCVCEQSGQTELRSDGLPIVRRTKNTRKTSI